MMTRTPSEGLLVKNINRMKQFSIWVAKYLESECLNIILENNDDVDINNVEKHPNTKPCQKL